MKPKKPNNHPDLFKAQLSQIINLKHPLVKMAHKINWDRLEKEINIVYSTGSGQPPLPTRLLAGLHYLKYSMNESDESVVARWVENPYWQYFCGFEFLQHELPLHPTTLIKWRNRVGDKLEALLKETIKVAQKSKLIKASMTHHVNVDTTAQEKNISFPTDAKLYQRARELLVKTANQQGIKLRQSYQRVGKIPKKASRTLRNWMKRRAAVESIIGHIKSDHRMNNNYLKGEAEYFKPSRDIFYLSEFPLSYLFRAV